MDSLVLTISKLKRWSINYYIDTAAATQRASTDLRRAGGGLGEYYSEHETRTPVWLCAGDTRAAARLVGLTDIQRAGGEADPAVVARWLDEGIAPNGRRGRGFGDRGVHGFDLTFCAPKSVSLVRALRAEDVVQKAIADAHTTAVSEAMHYLAQHAGYTRVHNGVTGEKDLLWLPGLVGIAYQHETSRCGDPHLHTHVIVPNRQARADGQLVSIDGTSLYHEAKAAGVIYQATVRRELHRSLGFEWQAVDPATGMAEVAGVDREAITAWSRRSSQLRAWATAHRAVAEGPLTAAQLAAAQKATRPPKAEELAWATLQQQWRADARGLHLDRAEFLAARAARRAATRTPFDRQRLAAAAEQIDKAAFTRADLVEIVAAQLPVDGVQAPRAAHQREAHERFTLDAILAEEVAVLDLVDRQEHRAFLWVKPEDTDGLSDDQRRAVENIGNSPFLVQPLSAPAGAGKTTSMRALVSAVHHRFRGTAIVLAPTGKAVDVAVREGAGDTGYTIAKALHLLERNELQLSPATLVIVDEAGMVGTSDLHQLRWPPPPPPAPRPSWSVTSTSSPQSRRAVGCSPNSAPICPGPNTCPRSGAWLTRPNAPPPWRCATAARRRFAALSTGTAPRIGCAVGIRSRWPPTHWPAGARTSADACNQRLHHDTHLDGVADQQRILAGGASRLVRRLSAVRADSASPSGISS
jgi:conjugative relaxase-like TrwC/TraI family protein